MSYSWQQQQAGQQQPQQQPQGFQAPQQSTFSQPFSGIQQQANSEIGQNIANMHPPTGGIPGSMNTMSHQSSFAGIQNAISGQDHSNDIDLTNLLSNYQPKMISTQIQQQQQQQQLIAQQAQDQQNPIGQASAAAAVAAYGHLGLQQAGSDVSNMGMYGKPSTSMVAMTHANLMQNAQGQGAMGSMPRSISGPIWNSVGQMQQQQPSAQQFGQEQQQSFPSNNSYQGRFINPITRNGGAVTGYEGDASATSSTQTPGASSGDDSNNNTKRRSNTVSYPSDKPGVKASARTGFVSSSSGSPDVLTTNNVPSGVRHNVAPDGSLQAPQRPLLRHRRSHSGSQVVTSSNMTWNDEPHIPMGKRLSGPSPSFSAAISQVAHYAQSLQTGHAASHPPGLGGQVLRGVEVGTGGSNAATDFTKRKGWHNRIVDELLDFVHVLDKDGRVIYAASSVGTLTGWKLEELRGRLISDFIHKDDSEAFLEEFRKCFEDKREMTMYYRFRKKPQTAEDKKRVRDQRIASNVGLSNSGSASEGDSSSNQDSQRKSVSTFADGSTEARAEGNDDDESDFRDDSEAKFVVFEVTGHPYFSNEDELESEKTDLFAEEGDHLEPTSPISRPHLTTAQPSPQSKKKGNRTSAPSNIKTETDTSIGGQDNEGSTSKKVKCFFLTGRVYPTKNVGMLDSFLELKLENERLRLLLGELSINDGSTALQAEGSSDGRRSLDEGAYPIDYPQDAESNRTGSTGHGIGQMGNGSLEDVSIANRNNSVHSLHSNASAPTSPQQVHLERSMTSNTIGGSTNAGEESDEAESPSLDGPDDPKRKKKKPKQEEGDYVCTDCGRVDSPEWRKGPLGPKTLCNACGLRWAKKIKRSGGDPNAVSKAGAAAKAQTAAKILGQTPMSSIPMNLAGPSHSFTGAANVMERPALNTSQSSGAAMYGQIHQHPQQPPLPRSATSFDTSMSTMQTAMYSASPTQMGFGPLPIQPGGLMDQQQHQNVMPPLMHHSSSFMSQPHISQQMANQLSQHQILSQQPHQQFQQPQQQQQQQQQMPFGHMPPNHSMF